MPAITGRLDTTVSLRCTPAEGAAAFSDLDRQVACRPEIAAADRLDARTLAVRMKEMKHGPTAFSGRYTLIFERDGDTVRWRTGPDSNMSIQGEARFSAAPGGSQLHFTESSTVELSLGRVAFAVARPIAETMMARGMRGFLDRMTGAIQGG